MLTTGIEWHLFVEYHSVFSEACLIEGNSQSRTVVPSVLFV